MKKLLKIMSLATLMCTLVACNGGNTSEASQSASAASSSAPASSATVSLAPVSSSSEAPASSSAAASSSATVSSAPVSSSEAPVSSSEAPVSSSEAPVSSSEAPVSSSEEVATPIVKTMDLSTMTATTTTDGFFTYTGCTFEATRLKTGGTGTYSASGANHVIEFTTTGAGKINLAFRGGTTPKTDGTHTNRTIYVAKVTDEATKAYEVFNNTGYNVGDVNTDAEIQFASAGTYVLLSSEGCSIYSLSVTYTEGAVAEVAPYVTTVTDADILGLTELLPGECDAKVYGNYTLNGTLAFRSKRKVGGIDGFNNYFELSEATDSIIFHAAGEGVLNLAGTTNTPDAASPLATLSLNGVANENALALDSGKSCTSISFTIAAAGDYTITLTDATLKVDIYSLAFAAI